jgi:hypothetical protein
MLALRFVVLFNGRNITSLYVEQQQIFNAILKLVLANVLSRDVHTIKFGGANFRKEWVYKNRSATVRLHETKTHGVSLTTANILLLRNLS